MGTANLWQLRIGPACATRLTKAKPCAVRPHRVAREVTNPRLMSQAKTRETKGTMTLTRLLHRMIIDGYAKDAAWFARELQLAKDAHAYHRLTAMRKMMR